MKAKFSKRLEAYFIDILILGLILMVIYAILPEGGNIQALNKEMSEIINLVLDHEITFSTFFERFTTVIHDLDTERAIYHVFNAFLIIAYFIIVPYFQNGQTIGMKIVKIKVERLDHGLIALNDLLIRSLIIHGLGSMMISLACIYVLSGTSYFVVTSIFSFIQILLVILCIFMILYRKDNRGLQDILSKTKVVTVKK